MRAAGHDPMAFDQPLLMQTYVAEDDATAKAEAEEHAMWYHDLFQKVLPGGQGTAVHPGYEFYDSVRKAHARVTYDDLSNWGSAFGDPDYVAQRILTYARQGGVNHWMAEMRFGGLSHEQTMRSMRLFAAEVMPRVRDGLAQDAAA